MTYNSVGLTNILLGCILIVNLIILLVVYQKQNKK
jgi:hypothetical protein